MSAYRLIISLLILISIPAYGKATDTSDPRFELWLGVFRSDHDSQIRVDSKDKGEGTEIDFEDDLGLEDALTRVLRGGFAWRFARKHTLSAEYYRFNRGSSSTANIEFDWEDITVEAGANLDTQLNIDILETHYEYALVQRPKHSFRGKAGIFWTNIEVELSADQVSIEGQPVSGEVSSSQSTSGMAPLPVLGLIYDWRFAHSWKLAASFDWFGLDTGTISGRMTNWDLGVFYQSPWLLSIGLNYTSYNFDLELDSDDWKGELEWKFSGPQLFLGMNF